MFNRSFLPIARLSLILGQNCFYRLTSAGSTKPLRLSIPLYRMRIHEIHKLPIAYIKPRLSRRAQTKCRRSLRLGWWAGSHAGTAHDNSPIQSMLPDIAHLPTGARSTAEGSSALSCLQFVTCPSTSAATLPSCSSAHSN